MSFDESSYMYSIIGSSLITLIESDQRDHTVSPSYLLMEKYYVKKQISFNWKKTLSLFDLHVYLFHNTALIPTSQEVPHSARNKIYCISLFAVAFKIKTLRE